MQLCLKIFYALHDNKYFQSRFARSFFHQETSFTFTWYAQYIRFNQEVYSEIYNFISYTVLIFQYQMLKIVLDSFLDYEFILWF